MTDASYPLKDSRGIPRTDTLRAAAVAALTTPELAPIVDLVAYAEGEGQGRCIYVANSGGTVRLLPDGSHQVLIGRDPVANTDPLHFLPYERELADPSPANANNAYPDPYRRLDSFLSHPDRSPDLVVVHTPKHFFPEQGGHHGEHGSLDVIQSRAPFLVSGAGVRDRGVQPDWVRMVDVGPTLLRAFGVSDELMVDATGAALDGTPSPLIAAPGPDEDRYVIGLLWDGAHCSDLLHLAQEGELPNAARLLAQGTALAGGAVAEFPSITLTNHTSALTGVGPGRHGIMGNIFYDRATAEQINANDATTWHRSADWLSENVRTVFEIVQQHAEATVRTVFTACVNEPIERGAQYSTMALIRASGTGDANAVLDDQLPAAESSPYLINPEHLKDDYYRWSTRADDAGLIQMLQLYATAQAAPRFTWWAAAITDAGHHAGGPRSDFARAALKEADTRLGVFLDHLESLGIWEHVTFLLTADHGFEGADESVRGSWAEPIAQALNPLGVSYRDEGPGLIYFDVEAAEGS